MLSLQSWFSLIHVDELELGALVFVSNITITTTERNYPPPNCAHIHSLVFKVQQASLNSIFVLTCRNLRTLLFSCQMQFCLIVVQLLFIKKPKKKPSSYWPECSVCTIMSSTFASDVAGQNNSTWCTHI